MTIEEAKKYGFRADENGALIVWTTVLDFMPCRPTKVQLGEKCVPLIGIHFPTRTEARGKKYWCDELQAKMDEAIGKANDARIKAKIDCYIAKGGPITKEQLTELRQTFGKYPIYFEISTSGEIQEVRMDAIFPLLSVVAEGRAFWNKSDAEHAKWLADMQSQTTPITPEQAKMLRDGDKLFAINDQGGIESCCAWSRHGYPTHTYFFTRSAAQAALDKAKLSRYERQHPYMDDAQYAACVEARDWDGADLRVDALDKAKAEAEPLEWCERKVGELIEATDSIWDWLSECWQEPHGRHVGEKLERDDMGCANFRARYRNPLWLAKHGKDVESHETPVGETQAKEVVTGETQRSTSRPLSDAEFKKLVGRMSLPQLYDALKANGVELEGVGLELKKVDEQSVLKEAEKCVTGPRRRDYGTPDENFGLIASLWSVQLKHEVTPMQVALCLILLKIARQANSPKRDNLVDIAGYAQCASELKGAK